MNAYRSRPGSLSSLGLLPESAGHLALDEALLQSAEAGHLSECLRIWESAETFVVLGAGGRYRQEVNLEAAHALAIPVLRRCSGGGTVVQGPACLNYVAVLDTRIREEARTVDGTTQLVLGSVIMALARQGLELRIEGTSDLAWGSRKVSGNAQRRRKNFILFHGTLLLSGFDRNLLGTLLTHPARQPDWRAQRLHEEFVDCLNVDPEQFQADWTSIWGAEVREDYPAEVVNLAREFVRTKYTQKEWNESL